MAKKKTRVRPRLKVLKAESVGSSLSGRTPSEAAASATVDIGSHDDGRQVVKALVVGPDAKIDGPVSRAMGDDPFKSLLGSKTILAPPLDPRLLSTIWEQNTILGPCIATMMVNCEAFGYQFVPRVPITEKTDPKVLRRMDEERIILDNFFQNSVIEGDLSFTGLRLEKRRDQESVGWGSWEVIEGHDNGPILGFNSLPAHTVRMSPLQGDRVAVKKKILVRGEDGTLRYVDRVVWRRFRKYVQVRGSKMVWFREFGDPRVMDYRDGEYKDPARVKPKYRATSVLFWPLNTSSRTPYSLPRYVGNLLGLYGSRAADETNFFTFESNNIPSMIVTVSNGMLSDGSVERLQEFVEKAVQGSRNYSRFLILEAEPVVEGVREPGKVGISVEKMSDQQRTDAMFVDYKKGGTRECRAAYRLPDIFFGEAPEGGAVGAMTLLRKLTDEQVFHPERMSFDERINRTVLPRLGVVYLKMQSNTPETTDNADLIRILAMAEKSGGVTPGIAREFLGRVAGRDLGMVESIPADVPFSLQVASAQRNQGDPLSANSVPGTNALRRMGAMTRRDLGIEKSAEVDEDTVEGEVLISALSALAEKVENALVEKRTGPGGHRADGTGPHGRGMGPGGGRGDGSGLDDDEKKKPVKRQRPKKIKT